MAPKRSLSPSAEGPPRKSRFIQNTAADKDNYRAKALAFFNGAAPLRDTRRRAPKTVKEEARLWDCWTHFCREMHGLDPSQVWIDIMEGNSIKGGGAVQWIMAFFRLYVESSTYQRVCLGPQEYETVRGVQSAVSVVHLWQTLRSKADEEVRHRLARDPAWLATWRLKCTTKNELRNGGPLARITLWLEDEMPDMYELSRDQTFTKVEMTSPDVLALLSTLWLRASDIFCDASTRLAFHSVVLVAAVGGFRPGTIMNLKYKQVAMQLIRDPQDPSQLRLVVTVTIHQNKQKQKVVNRSQDKVIGFSVTLVPCKMICLAGALVARALADEAFEIPFKSMADILCRPLLEGSDSLQLRWRPEFENKPIIPIVYPIFLALWHRTLIVAGAREDRQRPYSIRVGAGQRLDGPLTNALRNYVMAHHSGIFERSYQPRRIREDLLSHAFSADRAGSAAEIFQTMRNSLLSRDENAPIYPTKADLSSFEKRQDLISLRAEYQRLKTEHGSDCPEARRVTAKIYHIRMTLADLIVDQRRREYFREVDKLRAEGISTVGRFEQPPNPFRRRHLPRAEHAQRVGEAFQLDWSTDLGQSSVWHVDMLVAFLRNAPRDLARVTEEIKRASPSIPPGKDRDDNEMDVELPVPHADVEIPTKPHRCLFGCGSYGKRGNLTKHNTNVHFRRERRFDSPFPCPECLRLGLPGSTIVGPVSWHRHVLLDHGADHAPSVPPGYIQETTPDITLEWCLNDLDPRRCLVCGAIIGNGGGFSRHYEVVHIQGEGFGNKPFNCPECERLHDVQIWIGDNNQWSSHLAEAHGNVVYGHLHIVALEQFTFASQSRVGLPDAALQPSLTYGVLNDQPITPVEAARS